MNISVDELLDKIKQADEKNIKEESFVNELKSLFVEFLDERVRDEKYQEKLSFFKKHFIDELEHRAKNNFASELSVSAKILNAFGFVCSAIAESINDDLELKRSFIDTSTKAFAIVAATSKGPKRSMSYPAKVMFPSSATGKPHIIASKEKDMQQILVSAKSYLDKINHAFSNGYDNEPQEKVAERKEKVVEAEGFKTIEALRKNLITPFLEQNNEPQSSISAQVRAGLVRASTIKLGNTIKKLQNEQLERDFDAFKKEVGSIKFKELVREKVNSR